MILSAPRSHPWHSTDHHRPKGGFQNIWGLPREAVGLKALKWGVGFMLKGRQTGPLPASVFVDGEALREVPKGLRITWIGHAALLLQWPGLAVLTDPMFGERASPFSFAGPDRKPPLPISIEALPPVDLVLISHDHYDHLDEGSIRRLVAHHDPLFAVPLGLKKTLKGWGVSRVIELDWGQYAEADDVRLDCVPAKHFSGRGMHNRDGTLWCGWYIKPAKGPTVYFAGDSAYAPLFAGVRERLGVPDVALLPIGAYDPRWFMQPVHMDPEEAAQAALDLDAAHVLPIHWGTFRLTDEPLTEPPLRAEAAMKSVGAGDRLHVLPIGGSWELPAADQER